MPIRLMVIDDYMLVRTGLAQYFGMQPGVEVVAEAANGKELMEKLGTIPVDILLLDMVMPGISGAELIAQVKSHYPDLPILMLSMHYEVQTVLNAMNAGASGYISKNCSPQILFDAVKEVMKTGKYIGQDMAGQLAHAASSSKSL